MLDVKEKDNEMAAQKRRNEEHGLMSAQLGSVYDIPVSASVDAQSLSKESTQASSKVTFNNTAGVFSQVEGATYKP